MYSYACRDCDHRFDIQQAFTDDALTECPQCHGDLRKLFSAVGVVFKGSGFYRTDSRASNDTPAKATSSSGSSTPTSTSSSTAGSGSGSTGSPSTTSTGSAASG